MSPAESNSIPVWEEGVFVIERVVERRFSYELSQLQVHKVVRHIEEAKVVVAAETKRSLH